MENISSLYYQYPDVKSRDIKSSKSIKIEKEEEKYYRYVGIIMGGLVIFSIVISYLMPTVPL